MTLNAACLTPRVLEPISESPAMCEALLALRDVAPTPTTVLLLGEGGAGKGLLAHHLHARSTRAGGPFVVVHCAAESADLEAELFGPAAGGDGKLAQAAGGTLLLDEVGELPGPTQARLLRVLQDGEARRPGERSVRVVATSSADLRALVNAGRFRSDLYYRLNVFPIAVPPLRARAEDVIPLSRALVEDAAAAFGLEAPPMSAAAEEALSAHSFHGNVRELRNLVERAVVRCHGAEIRPEHLGLAVPSAAAATARPAGTPGGALPPELPLDLGQLERLAIEEALRRVQGNRTHAARLLGIGLRTLRNKLRLWREAGVPCAEVVTRPTSPGDRGPAVPLPAGFAAAAWARRSHQERA